MMATANVVATAPGVVIVKQTERPVFQELLTNDSVASCRCAVSYQLLLLPLLMAHAQFSKHLA